MRLLTSDGDDDYGDDFEEEAEDEDSSRRIIRMCYCCGSTRESEKSIREHVLIYEAVARAGSATGRRPGGGPLRASGWCRLPGPAAASDTLKAYSAAAGGTTRPTPLIAVLPATGLCGSREVGRPLQVVQGPAQVQRMRSDL